MIFNTCKKLLFAIVVCFGAVFLAKPLSAMAATSVMVPHATNANAPLKEVRYVIGERSLEITFVTDGFKDAYVMEGGNSFASWRVDFTDGKHNYETFCRTPYGEEGSFTMDDMSYMILVDIGGGNWRGISCSHVVNGNEVTWLADALPSGVFEDPIDVDAVQITSYYLYEYHDQNVGAVKLNWTLDDNGKLTIRDGQEDMPLTTMYQQKDKVKSIDLDVTTFPTTANFFASFENLETATLKAGKMKGSTLDGLFKNCTKLRTVDLSGFNTEGITRMESMFENCTFLESVNLSGLNTEKVTTMWFMFNNCHCLTSLDLSSFRTPELKNLGSAFRGCCSLTSLDVSMLDTSKVINADGAFACYMGIYDEEGQETLISNLKTLKLGDFSTASMESAANMFEGCCSLTNLDVSKFDTSKMKNMGNMFQDCRSLVSLDVSHFNTESATSMISMFYGCSSLKSLNVSHFNTSKVTKAAFMFYGCDGLESLDLSNFDLSSATNVNWFLDLTPGKLQTIKTPKNLALNCALPMGNGVWKMESTGAEVMTLPKNSDTSEMLVWSQMQGDPEYKIAKKSITLFDTITIDFKVQKAALEGKLHDPYLLAEQNGFTSKITSYEEKGDYLIFHYRVAPHMMNREVTVIPRALDAEGRDVVGEAFTYSVAYYCYSMLNKDEYQTSEYAKLRRLLTDILLYGDAAQKYTNFKTDDLAGRWLTDEQLAMGTDVTVPMVYNNVKDVNYGLVSASDAKAEIVTAALYLEAAVNVQIKFTAEDLTGLWIEIRDDERVIGELIPKPSEKDGNGRYYVTFDGLNAGQMRKTIYATVMEGNKAVSNVMRYSIESYAATQTESEVPNLPELLHAMMRYGDSAAEYVK